MAKTKSDPRIKVKIEQVSDRSLFGRKSQMDKTIEKYLSQGWKLTGRRAVPDKKDTYKLQFKYRLSDEEVATEKRRERNKRLILAGTALACTVIFCLMSLAGQSTRNAEATQDAFIQATLIAMEQATNDAQATQDTFATQTATVWTPTPTLTPTITPSITPTFTPTETAIPSNTPTVTFTPSITPTITLTLTPVPTATQAFSQQVEVALNNAAVFRKESLVNDIYGSVQVVFGTSQGSASLDLFEVFCAVQPVLIDTDYVLRLVGEITEFNRIIMTISNDNIPTVDCSRYQAINWQAIADIEYAVPSNISLSGQSGQSSNTTQSNSQTSQTNAVQSVTTTTYYVSEGSVNVRECPQLNDSICPHIASLFLGNSIQVTGSTQGDEYRTSTLWYQFSLNGREAYIHSSLVQPNPIATAVPVQPQTSSSQSQPIAPSSNCDCRSGDTLNCSNFSSRTSAQACFNQCMQEVGYDVHGLDGNGDGQACESL